MTKELTEKEKDELAAKIDEHFKDLDINDVKDVLARIDLYIDKYEPVQFNAAVAYGVPFEDDYESANSNLILVDPGQNRLKVMSFLRKELSLSLSEIKGIIDKCPVVLIEKEYLILIERMKSELEKLDAIVEIR